MSGFARSGANRKSTTLKKTMENCKDITRNSYLDRKYEKYQRARQELAVCVGDYADNKPGRNWKPKLDISMVIRVEGSKEPHAEHSR